MGKALTFFFRGAGLFIVIGGLLLLIVDWKAWFFIAFGAFLIYYPTFYRRHNTETKKPLIGDFVVIDLETTGLSPAYDEIIEIGAVKYECGEVVDAYATFVDPGQSIPKKITSLTGITDEDVKDAPYPHDAVEELVSFIGDLPVVGHNVKFDIGFISEHDPDFDPLTIDTLPLAREILPDLPNHKLATLKTHFGLAGQSHRAIDDCRTTGSLYLLLLAHQIDE